uniref:Zonadhesin-like n=1 Tax=Saccoglossus kowalevskii TaxID=10224 RepID=A0ABM0M7P7_SACKO
TITVTVDISEGGKAESVSRTMTTACPCNPASETGDPHYSTFDNNTFTYQGPCGYIVSKDACDGGTPTFEICATNSGREGQTDPRFVTGVHVKTESDELLLSRHTVLWNGEVVDKSIPKLSTDYKLLTYTSIDGRFVLFHTEYLWWIEVLTRTLHVYLHQDSPLHGNICGMFGNADGSPFNDMVLPDGTSTEDQNVFGYAWECENSCYYKELLDDLGRLK